MPNQKVLDRSMQLLDVKASELRVYYNKNKKFPVGATKALVDLAETVVAAYEDEKRKNDS